jgi:Ca2+-binding RTX toxin-like protein
MFTIIGLFGFALATIMLTPGDHGSASDTFSDSDAPQPRDTDATGYFSGDGDDMVQGGDSGNYIDGEDGDDILWGGEGDDELHGGAGNDTLLGEDSDDSLFGHIGNDDLTGGDGDDFLNGGAGQDRLAGGEGHDSLLGSLGDDTLSGGDGTDVLNGGSGNDVLHGDDDTLRDYLNGSDGDDRLIAGPGDNLNGGAGADTFALPLAAGARVEDFDPTSDRIEVIYDPDQGLPELTTLEDADGLTLLADGHEVAYFAGLAWLDLSRVMLVQG